MGCSPHQLVFQSDQFLQLGILLKPGQWHGTVLIAANLENASEIWIPAGQSCVSYEVLRPLPGVHKVLTVVIVGVQTLCALQEGCGISELCLLFTSPPLLLSFLLALLSAFSNTFFFSPLKSLLTTQCFGEIIHSKSYLKEYQCFLVFRYCIPLVKLPPLTFLFSSLTSLCIPASYSPSCVDFSFWKIVKFCKFNHDIMRLKYYSLL